MGLGDTIGRWLGRVEIVLAGLDDRLRDGEEALAKGDVMRARAAAHAILAKVPGSPHGLALLADACEAAGLDAELELTLEELAKRAASQAEVWVRLAHARRSTGSPPEQVRDALVRAVAVAEPGSPARRAALVALADLDLSLGDGARADLWLDRVAEDKATDVARRRAEARLASHDAKGAVAWLERAGEDPVDGRLALVRGKVFSLLHDERAFPALLRAMVLGEAGASEALSSALAWTPSAEAVRERIRTVVESTPEAGSARWRAAFARAEGRREDARRALIEAVESGSVAAVRPLLDAGLEDQDEVAIARALAALGPDDADEEVRDARRLVAPETDPIAILDALARVHSPRALPLAATKRARLLAQLLPEGAPAAWKTLLARVDAHARSLADLDAIAHIAELSAERARPLRIAIVGEFNAGKSTFINALIGQDVAPTGVLPTTATLHHLRYAPDPIARIFLEPADDPSAPLERIVPTSELRATLKGLDAARVRRVEIMLPIASLTRAEILDTPGFNAPDERHTRAARSAFDEADVAIWLLDAGQPLKQTERAILEDAKKSGLPVQMLINKADRLHGDDLPKVVAVVRASLAEVGLTSYREPIAFSARLALAGKLGDGDALARSGWERVSELLDLELVARSDELKERALRRRLASVAAALAARADLASARRREHESTLAANRRACAAAAARLDHDSTEGAKTLVAALAPHVDEWRADVEIVATGRDARDATADPVLARYGVERAVARLVSPASVAIATLTGETGTPASEWSALARVTVRAAAASAALPKGSDTSAFTAALASALLAGAIDDLAARALPSSSAPAGDAPFTDATTASAELAAIASAAAASASSLQKAPT